MNIHKSDHSEYINLLRLTEKQFQLMVAIRLACTSGTQPLLVPDLWIYGKNKLEGRQIQLTVDSAEEASAFLEHTIIHTWAIHIWQAIKAIVESPRNHTDTNIVAAYEISRLIRNAYTHSPFVPVWSIDPYCQNKTYEIDGTISLNTTNLQNEPMHWEHYGGFIALWNLSHWIRLNILHDKEIQTSDAKSYIPSNITQQGRFLINKNSEIPDNAEKIPLNIKETSGKKYAIISSDSDGEYKIELNEKMNNVELYKFQNKIYLKILPK